MVIMKAICSIRSYIVKAHLEKTSEMMIEEMDRAVGFEPTTSA